MSVERRRLAAILSLMSSMLLACGGSTPRAAEPTESAPREAETVAGGEGAPPGAAAAPTPARTLASSVPVPELVEIGLGSGRDGLATIRIDGQGVLVVHRPGIVRGTDRGTFVLTDAQWLAIAERIDRDQIYAMDGTYSAGRMDGTQLVLRIVQDGDQTVIYCDNQFPDAVFGLYEAMQQIVDESRGDLRWETVDAQTHDDALWEAVRGSRRR